MRILRIFGTLLCGVLCLPLTSRAQEVTIVGTITDSTDAVLPGVTVTALKLDNGNTFVEVSDASGNYRLSLRSGIYKVTVRKDGFRTMIRFNVKVANLEAAVVDFTLSVGAVVVLV